jgi:presenilin-like A22 family membrane protease
MFLQNVSLPEFYIAPHPRRQHSSVSLLFASCSILLTIQPSTQQIRNKQINIIVLIFVYYVYLLHVSIRLHHHHHANIHEMYTHTELY